MQATIKRLTLPHDRRILVTSDIHGHLTHFERLLGRVGFSEDDLLVIVGDMIQKGTRNLETLQYIMKLSGGGDLFVTAGNVDLGWIQSYDSLDSESAGEFFDALCSMRSRGFGNVFDEMAERLGLRLDSPDSLLENKWHIDSAFTAELEFLRSRPTAIEADRFIFVHGGLPTATIREAEELDEFALLKFDNFLNSIPEGRRFGKWVIVGHWPVTLYGDRLAQAAPIIDREHRVISLDGGIGLKNEGQLNLLVIPAGSSEDADKIEFSHLGEDLFPMITVLEPQTESDDDFYIRWGDCEVKVIAEDGGCRLIEHLRTGHRMYVPAGYLYAGETRCDDASDYRPELLPGERVALVRETSHGAFIKKNGVSGRYLGSFERSGTDAE